MTEFAESEDDCWRVKNLKEVENWTTTAASPKGSYKTKANFNEDSNNKIIKTYNEVVLVTVSRLGNITRLTDQRIKVHSPDINLSKYKILLFDEKDIMDQKKEG